MYLYDGLIPWDILQIYTTCFFLQLLFCVNLPPGELFYLFLDTYACQYSTVFLYIIYMQEQLCFHVYMLMHIDNPVSILPQGHCNSVSNSGDFHWCHHCQFKSSFRWQYIVGWRGLHQSVVFMGFSWAMAQLVRGLSQCNNLSVGFLQSSMWQQPADVHGFPQAIATPHYTAGPCCIREKFLRKGKNKNQINK